MNLHYDFCVTPRCSTDTRVRTGGRTNAPKRSDKAIFKGNTYFISVVCLGYIIYIGHYKQS